MSVDARPEFIEAFRKEAPPLLGIFVPRDDRCDAAGACRRPVDGAVRIPMMSDSDSDRRRTLIPIQGGQGFRLIPSRVFVDVGMESGDSLGVKGQRFGSPFS